MYHHLHATLAAAVCGNVADTSGFRTWPACGECLNKWQCEVFRCLDQNLNICLGVENKPLLTMLAKAYAQTQAILSFGYT